MAPYVKFLVQQETNGGYSLEYSYPRRGERNFLRDNNLPILWTGGIVIGHPFTLEDTMKDILSQAEGCRCKLNGKGELEDSLRLKLGKIKQRHNFRFK